MPRNVRCALIHAGNAIPTDRPLEQIRKAMVDKHLKLIEQAAKKKAQILCLQELFYGPYFCAEQNARWYELTEKVPDGPTTKLMQKIAAEAPKGANILAMLPDTGERYLSTPLFANVPADMTPEEQEISRSTPSAQFP